MDGKCENCLMILHSNEDRVNWSKKISADNLKLLHKVEEQDVIIAILRQKVDELMISKINDLRSRSSDFEGPQLSDMHQNLMRQCEEIDQYLADRAELRSSLKKRQEERLTSYKEMVSYFRDGLFQEIEKSNEMKQFYLRAREKIEIERHENFARIVTEATDNINEQCSSRYKTVISEVTNRAQQKDALIVKYRMVARDLQRKLQQTKLEYDKNLVDIKENLKQKNTEITHLKKMCANMKTKLEQLRTCAPKTGLFQL